LRSSGSSSTSQPYRQTEGFVHFLSRFVEGLQAPDYSTIDRRVNRLRIDLDESLIRSNEPVSIAVDSSGVKVHNGGDWIRYVWKVKKGYLKIHFAVDIRTGQVVSMDVSSEKVGDGKRLVKRLVRRLVKRAEEKVRVKRVLADGAYDSKANFNFLAGEGGDQASNQGQQEGFRAQEQGEPCEEARRHRAAGRRSSRRRGATYTGSGTGGGSRERSPSSRGSSGNTSRQRSQYGKGDCDEGLDLQRVHQGDGVVPRGVQPRPCWSWIHAREQAQP
jgi:IS5 family transposase